MVHGLTALAVTLAWLPLGSAPPEVGQPITAHGLTVYPLLAAEAAQAGRAPRTLGAALRDGTLALSEATSAGVVTRLVASNEGEEPVLLLAGEVLLGGKQDRVVARDVLVPAGAADVAVPVFGVEHGRWWGAPDRWTTAGALAHLSLRRAVRAGSQGAVWAEVRRVVAARGAESATDAYRHALRAVAAAPTVRAMIDPIRDATHERGAVQGAVIAVNGVVVGAEWFASPASYRTHEAALLASYAAEALDRASEPQAEPPSLDRIVAWLERLADRPGVHHRAVFHGAGPDLPLAGG